MVEGTPTTAKPSRASVAEPVCEPLPPITTRPSMPRAARLRIAAAGEHCDSFQALFLRQTHDVRGGLLLGFRQRLDVLELALDLARARLGLIDRVRHRLQLHLGAGKDIGKLAELRLHPAQ